MRNTSAYLAMIAALMSVCDAMSFGMGRCPGNAVPVRKFNAKKFREGIWFELYRDAESWFNDPNEQCVVIQMKDYAGLSSNTEIVRMSYDFERQGFNKNY